MAERSDRPGTARFAVRSGARDLLRWLHLGGSRARRGACRARLEPYAAAGRGVCRDQTRGGVGPRPISTTGVASSCRAPKAFSAFWEARTMECNRPDLTDERLARLIRTAARGFNRALSIRLSQHDVTFGQWIFLRILWPEDGLSQRELARRAGVTEPTTHSALRRLEAQGL